VLLFLLLLLLALGLINFYFSVQILRRVSSAETKPSFFEIRWQVHRSMKRYKDVTRSDSGKIGFAWYGYWLSLIAMVLIIVASAFFLVDVPAG
jgi:hypothetical protein